MRARSLEDLDLLRLPPPRVMVDQAQRTNNMPVGTPKRHAQISNHPEILDRRAPRGEGCFARVLDHQGLTVHDDVPAEGVRQGCLAVHAPWLGKPMLRQEELAAFINHGDQGDRRVEDQRREPRHAVERLLGRHVEQTEVLQDIKARGIRRRRP
jgi:hypothetical protein